MSQFRASDGVRIAYEVVGNGRPLVLLHGLMAHKGFFDAQRSLSPDFQLIRVDLRGHGDSRGGDRYPSVARIAADVAELVRDLDLEGAIGVGWSLGASVLWRVLAGAEGHRFAGAVVIDMTARVLNEGEWQLGLSPDTCEARSASIRDDYTNFALAAGQNIFAQPVENGRRDLANWAGEQFRLNDPSTMGAVWASLVDSDDRDLLPKIEQPTLIVHGTRSQLYGPETARYLTTTLPHARALAFDHSGHAPHMEEPERFNAIIRDFAASLPPLHENQTNA